MTAETRCPHCQARFRVKAEFIGRRAQCKTCGQAFVLTETSSAANMPAAAQPPESYLGWFDAIKAELAARFGPADDSILTATLPLYLEPERGGADVLTFRKFIPGFAYCTCGLSSHFDLQKPGPFGFYELMICSRDEAPFLAQAVSGLAAYTLKTVLKPGDTIDLGPQQPPGANLRGMLCAPPPTTAPNFQLFGRTHSVLLLMGITASEMEACREYGYEGVLGKLRNGGAFPYTTLAREAVL